MYDYDYKLADGRPQSKIFFVSWLPENASPHQMMAYSSAKSQFRDNFTGVTGESENIHKYARIYIYTERLASGP